MSQSPKGQHSVQYVPRSDLVLPINQLSRPKGAKYDCEICGKPGKLMATECPAYYCSYEHFDIDWRGIKSLIAQDLVYIKADKGDQGEKKAEELKAVKKELLELCTETAQKFLVQGKYDLAVPGALQGLKFAIEVYGSESVELVASYLLLAEANLGLRKLKVAEEFLSLANWNLLKEGGESKLMSHLQRNFGRLYAAQQRYQESIQAFAVDIYYSCQEHGPDHVRTAPSYFHMGRVFQSYQKKQDRAEAFYSKVVSNVIGHFEKTSPTSSSSSGGGGAGASSSSSQPVGENGESSVDQITAVEAEEVFEIVKHIEDYRTKKQAEESDAMWAKGILEAQYCLGLLCLFMKDVNEARNYLSMVAGSSLKLSCVVAAKDLVETLV